MKQPNYICSDCAEAKNGKWPEGHLATWHEGDCDICGEKKGLASVRDWIFPGDKKNVFNWD